VRGGSKTWIVGGRWYRKQGKDKGTLVKESTIGGVPYNQREEIRYGGGERGNHSEVGGGKRWTKRLL